MHLYEIGAGGKLSIRFHPGQFKAWNSRKRFVAVIAGSQGGKTSFGPLWLWRELRRCGPGDYLVATPTYQLLELKALPEFQRFFVDTLRLGRVLTSPIPMFILSDKGAERLWGKRFEKERRKTPTRVIFRHAMDPEGLEAMTAKAAWLDECGQKKFRFSSYEAIRRRVGIHRGRILMTTTPYNLGWLKKEIYDPWRKAQRSGEEHPLIDVIRFESRHNPAFSMEEWEERRQSMQRWRFNMMYRGIFTRPAGVIYDCFRKVNICPRFAIPDGWHRHVGIDFGGVNTAAVYFAEEPGSGRLFLYRIYHKAGKKTAEGHKRELLKGEPRLPHVVGGSWSEDQWRDEYAAAGLPISEPDIRDVEVGIDRVYGAIQRAEVVVFDDLLDYLEEIDDYSREVDDMGNPTEKIEDKETYHLMDATRYIIVNLRGGAEFATDDDLYNEFHGEAA